MGQGCLAMESDGIVSDNVIYEQNLERKKNVYAEDHTPKREQVDLAGEIQAALR